MKIPVVKFVYSSMKCSLFLLKFFNYNAFFGNFFQTSIVFFLLLQISLLSFLLMRPRTLSLFAEATPGPITLEVRSPFLTVANSFSFSAKGNL